MTTLPVAPSSPSASTWFKKEVSPHVNRVAYTMLALIFATLVNVPDLFSIPIYQPPHVAMYEDGIRLFKETHGLTRPHMTPLTSASSPLLKQSSFNFLAPEPSNYTFAIPMTNLVTTPSSKAASASGGSSGSGADAKRKRKRQDDDATPENTRDAVRYKCAVCLDTFDSVLGWQRHVERAPTCAAQGAVYHILDPESERQQEATAQNAKTGRVGYETQMEDFLVEKYSHLRYEKLLPHTTVDHLKDDVIEPLLSQMKAELLKRWSQRSSTTGSTFEEEIQDVFDVHRGIETASREHHKLVDMVKPVEPQKRELIDQPDESGKRTGPQQGDFVYDMPMQQELEKMFKSNPELVAELRRAADSWAEERPTVGSSRFVYADLSDGCLMQSHPELGVNANRSDGSLRLAFILYYDDLEIVNALGAFHGRHKLGMFYWALVNMDAPVRMAFHNLHLMTVALTSDIDYYGIQQVLSGLPGDTSFGSAMTALDSGLRIKYLQGKQPLLVRGWCVCLSADFPAAALCCGFKKSVSAACFCRECDVNQNDADYPSAVSFLDENDDLLCDLCLRDKRQMLDNYDAFCALQTAKDRTAFLADIGMNTFDCHGFVRVPHFGNDAPYNRRPNAICTLSH